MRLVLVVALLTGAAATAGCAPPAPPTPGEGPAPEPSQAGGLAAPAGAQHARVVRVVDGDTLDLVGESAGQLPVGRNSRVRLVGVDAPEVGERAECFGAQAAARLADLVPPGTRVRVSPDRELRDAYGRELRYLWDERGTLVNLELVRDGAAEALLVRPNDRYIAELRAAEAQARRARRGRWAACP